MVSRRLAAEAALRLGHRGRGAPWPARRTAESGAAASGAGQPLDGLKVRLGPGAGFSWGPQPCGEVLRFWFLRFLGVFVVEVFLGFELV